MDETTKYNMAQAMKAYGGGFVKALGECFILADENNTNRLVEAFPEYVERYLAMAGRDMQKHEAGQ